jgi:hypothetical protein
VQCVLFFIVGLWCAARRTFRCLFSIVCCLSWVFSVVRVAQSLVFCAWCVVEN